MKLLDKVCKKVLKQMHSDGPPERFAFWLIDDALKLEADKCGLPVEEFANAINQLIAEGWAEYVFSRNNNRSGVKLTHKGVHYKEYMVSEQVKTFLIPAVVSVITTLSTIAVKSLFPLLLQLLSSSP